MKRSFGLNLMEKAMIRKDWSIASTSAQIHAFTGNDASLVLDKAGRVLYVILGAAATSGYDRQHVDFRIVLGAINALHDQAGNPVLSELIRGSIIAGLYAAERIRASLNEDQIFKMACDLEMKLRRRGGVVLADFMELIGN